MRAFLFASLAALLAACAPPSPNSGQHSAQAAACARTATHAVNFSNSQSPDTITARAEGPSCKQAVVMFVLRDSAGNPLWTLANTYYDLTAGGNPPPDAPAVTDTQMDTFLAGWANVSMTRTNALPAWREGQTALGTVGSFAYDTSLPRESYEMLRARNLPLLCYAAAAEATQCLVMDPATGSPTMMVAYGP